MWTILVLTCALNSVYVPVVITTALLDSLQYILRIGLLSFLEQMLHGWIKSEWINVWINLNDRRNNSITATYCLVVVVLARMTQWQSCAIITVFSTARRPIQFDWQADVWIRLKACRNAASRHFSAQLITSTWRPAIVQSRLPPDRLITGCNSALNYAKLL